MRVLNVTHSMRMSTPIRRDWGVSRNAFTLVELLVTIAIIGILIGLLAPSLQAMRESSRRASCQSNLTSIGLAIQSYHDQWMHYPVGTIAETSPIKSEAVGLHHNWLGRLMDSMDQPVIAKRIDRSVSVYDERNADVLRLSVPGLKCPSETCDPENVSSYVGLHHESEKSIADSDHGVFILNVPISRDDVSDGLSNTAFISEKLTVPDDLGWLSGTRATLRNVGGGIQTEVDLFNQEPVSVVGSIGSRHPSGVHLLFGSGAIQFLTTQTDQRVLEQLVDRRDGQLPLHFQSIEELRRRSVQ